MGDREEKYCVAEDEYMDDVRTNAGAYVYCSVGPATRCIHTLQYKASRVPAYPSYCVIAAPPFGGARGHASIVIASANRSRTCG